MKRKIRTKEEIRRYDILKGIVAAIIALLLLASGYLSPNDLSGGAGDAAAPQSGTVESAAAEGEVAEAPAEATAPELLDPALGSELQAGAVTLSGLGMPGSRVAVLAGDLELGQTAVDDAGGWQMTVNLAPEISDLILQTLDEGGETLAESAPIPITVTAPSEPLSVDPLPQGARSATIVISGTGQPEYEVAIDVNGEQAASTTVEENGAWSADVDAGSETAEISVRMLNPAGELVEEVAAGEVAAVESIPPSIDMPDEDLQAGDVTLSGSGEPGTTVALSIGGDEIGTAVVGEDGAWTANVTLPAGSYDIEAAALDESGDAGDGVVSVSLTVAEAEPPSFEIGPFALPSFSALTGSLALDGAAEPGSRVAAIVDDEVVSEAVAGSDGRWQLRAPVPAGEHNLAFGRLNEDGDTVSVSDTTTIDLPGKLPQITLPDFALPDDFLPFAGLRAQAADGAETAAGSETEEIDALEIPTIQLPAGPFEVSGTAEPGMEIALLVDDEVVDTATAGDDGAFTLGADLAEGNHDVQLGVVNEDGDLSGQSAAIPVSASDAAVPTLVGPQGAAAGETVTLSGTADPGATVEITVDGVSVGETEAAADGSWSFDLPDIPQVAANIRARLLGSDGLPLLLSAPFLIPGSDETAAAGEGAGSDAGATAGAEATVSGEVTYSEDITLPDDAILTVQIQDISRADSSAEIIGEQIIETDGQQVPIPYEVSYDPAVTEENHTYNAAARIEDSSGNLLFISDTATPVITGGNPTEDVTITAVKVDTAVSDLVLDETESVLGEETQSAVEAAEGSGDFSTLLDGLEAAGLSETLADVDGQYTLFAPTDEAFASLPQQIVDAWNENPEAYADLMRNMAVEGKFTPEDLEDGMVLQTVGGSEIAIARDGDVIYANGAAVVDAAEAGSHYVYALPQVILPPLPAGVEPPVIDESGVPTFVGPLLTVVGLAEPGSNILLTVDDEPFGEIAVVEPDGFWLVRENVDSGIRYILGYMLDDQGLLLAISQEVILPVP
jgi:large repetitive protein